MPSDIAVVVVTYNSEKSVGQLLNSLPAALGTTTADVIVVDNGSSDRTCELILARGDSQLIRSTNEGYAAGLNRGAAASDAPAILLLNPDAILRPGSVPPLLARLDDRRVGVVVPRILDEDGQLHFSLRREPSLGRAVGLSGSGAAYFSEYIQNPATYETSSVVDWALGAVMLIARPCYDATQGWDESYFLYSEETDFCLRIRDLGWTTRYEPQSTAVHIGGLSGRTSKTHTMQIVNRVRLYTRRNPKPKAYCYLGLTILSELSWVVRGHRESRVAVRALMLPSRRPAELRCGSRVLPQ